MSPLTQSPAWQALQSHYAGIYDVKIADLFAADPERFEHFALRVEELLLDYSKNLINAETMKLLAALARERGLGDQTQRLFNGARINTTEDRPVLHTALRDERPIVVDGTD